MKRDSNWGQCQGNRLTLPSPLGNATIVQTRISLVSREAEGDEGSHRSNSRSIVIEVLRELSLLFCKVILKEGWAFIGVHRVKS